MKAEYEQMPGKVILDSEQKQKTNRRFEVKDRSGNDVISIKNLQAIYETSDNDGSVIDIPSLDIRRQEKVALIGKNGSGKSTLMKILAGDDSDMVVDGECKMGASIDIGYYSPTTAIPAREDETIVGATTQLDAHPSGILRYWGFNDGDSYKTTVSELKEDDEKTRMQLALIMAKKPNLLLLDEPTSYLTPSYQEKLVDALKDYEGTMLIISHNPDFLAKLGLTGRIVMPEGKKETF
jgi:ATP-binding cassette subfamily F protein 3